MTKISNIKWLYVTLQNIQNIYRNIFPRSIPRNKEDYDSDENGYVPSDNHSVLVTSDALPFVAYCAPVRFSKILTMWVISMMRIKMDWGLECETALTS